MYINIINMFHPLQKKFVDSYSFFERTGESNRIMKKFPDRIPIICEKRHKDTNTPHLDKNKYLVPHDITLAQFMYVIRKRIRLTSNDAVFLFVGDLNHSLPCHTLMYDAYNQFKSKDGFLYIIFSKENTFGSPNK